MARGGGRLTSHDNLSRSVGTKPWCLVPKFQRELVDRGNDEV